MKRGAYFSIAGLTVVLAVAGCGRGMLQYGERASWRHQAEVNCLKAGGVKIGTGVVQVSPIDGPGMCGADFPLKVAALGESSAAIGYADVPRPPGGIPRAGETPNWPPTQTRYAPPPSQPIQSQPVYTQPVQAQPVPGRRMEWNAGPQGISAPQAAPPAGQPMSINPPGVAPPEPTRAMPEPELDEPDDIPDDAVLPGRGRPSPPRTQPAYNAPVYQQQRQPSPALGPARPQAPTQAVTLSPTATLACPIVSALDRWVAGGVQPAALRWFNQPVVEIKQISAYSCRGMVGSGTSTISEHAFGNALDVAGFIFADGRKIMVKDGWHGSPEEQGFLHDVQLYACDTFTTVLAPGYNAAHYNHIHVDLMRRANGRRPCRPDAVPGEIAAAKARAVYASKGRGPAYTGSIKAPITIGALIKGLPDTPGEDGLLEEDDTDTTGSIPDQPEEPKAPSGGSWFSRLFSASSKASPSKAASTYDRFKPD